MRLARAASAFDKTECRDAYSGKLAFYGQLGLYDDTKRDSEAGERRVLSTGPEVKLPARRVVALAGKRYILGTSYPDTYRGKVIRQGIVAHEAPYLARVQTLGQACRNQAGLQAWAAKAWIKRSADHEQSSDLVGQFHLHFSASEDIPAYRLITMGGEVHVSRAAHVGPAGTLVVFADAMPEPTIETVVFSTGSVDRIYETQAAGTTAAQIVRLRWQSIYELQSHASEKYGPKDIQVLVSTEALTPKAGMKFMASDGTWMIAAAFQRDGAWVCRAVHHG